jgi:hypothetical protein
VLARGRGACTVHALTVNAEGRHPTRWTGEILIRAGRRSARTAGETDRALARRLERELAAWRPMTGIATIPVD